MAICSGGKDPRKMRDATVPGGAKQRWTEFTS